jgi:hypothetical protein
LGAVYQALTGYPRQHHLDTGRSMPCEYAHLLRSRTLLCLVSLAHAAVPCTHSLHTMCCCCCCCCVYLCCCCLKRTYAGVSPAAPSAALTMRCPPTFAPPALMLLYRWLSVPCVTGSEPCGTGPAVAPPTVINTDIHREI